MVQWVSVNVLQQIAIVVINRWVDEIHRWVDVVVVGFIIVTFIVVEGGMNVFGGAVPHCVPHCVLSVVYAVPHCILSVGDVCKVCVQPLQQVRGTGVDRGCNGSGVNVSRGWRRWSCDGCGGGVGAMVDVR